jgi:hypothetical protein
MFQQTFICRIHLKKCIPLFLLKRICIKTYHKNLFIQNHRKLQSGRALNISSASYFRKKHLYEFYFNVHVILEHFFKAQYVK